MTSSSELTVHEHWEQLVTVALLGTDRRDPPDVGGPVAELVADAVRASPAERLLDEVAAVTAVRRAGFMPLDPIAMLDAPAADDRPMCSAAAADRWHHVVTSWPVLEDEWMLTLIERGWRVDPQVVPAMFRRHRRDPVRWTRAVVAAGPLAGWLTDLLPQLDLAGNANVDRQTFEESIGELPSLPIPPDLAVLCSAAGADVARLLCSGLADGMFGPAHRIVLVNLIARVRPDGLDEIAAALSGFQPDAGPHEMAAALADLARTRSAMLAELLHPAPDP